jgi:photosystem II stability/assembly factor-like uncharacterized protein
VPNIKPVAKTLGSRVWFTENQAGPANQPAYMGYARAGGLSWPQGDVTPIRVPSNESYDASDIVDEIQGQQGMPSMPVMFREPRDRSDALRIARKRCPLDVQIHFGACKDPSDHDAGWDKILVIERGRPTAISTDDLGAFDGDGNAPITETLPITGRTAYEILPVNGALQAATEITDEVIDVVICDSIQCGDCGIPSDGTQVVFAVVRDNSGSPGLPSEVIYTSNAGATWGRTNVTTMSLAETATSIACIGGYLVVASNGGNAYHIALISALLLGVATWTKVTTGLVALGALVNFYSYNRTHTWVCGLGGYVYLMTDPTAGVTPQTSGDVTAQNLNSIHGIDDQNIAAVGGNNAVILSNNGGSTWSAITGPAVGVVLNAVWMRSKSEWFVGSAAGRLYYTRNGGLTWIEKLFPGSGTGRIRDIQFANAVVGYMAYEPALGGGSARVLRTVNGGYSWYAIPETTGQVMPSSSLLNAIATTRNDPNVAYAAGLAPDNNDGVLIKIA